MLSWRQITETCDGQRLHGAEPSDRTAEPSSTSGAGGNSVANVNEPQGV